MAKSEKRENAEMTSKSQEKRKKISKKTRGFYFPEHGLTISAVSQEEALEKLGERLNETKLKS